MDPVAYDRHGRALRSMRFVACYGALVSVFLFSALIMGPMLWRWSSGPYYSALAKHTDRVAGAISMANSSTCTNVTTRSIVSSRIDCDYEDRLAALNPENLAWSELMDFLSLCVDGQCMWGGFDLAALLLQPLFSWSLRIGLVLAGVIVLGMFNACWSRQQGFAQMPMTAQGVWTPHMMPSSTKLVEPDNDYLDYLIARRERKP